MNSFQLLLIGILSLLGIAAVTATDCNCDWTCSEQRRRHLRAVESSSRKLAPCTVTDSGCGWFFSQPCTGYNAPNPCIERFGEGVEFCGSF